MNSLQKAAGIGALLQGIFFVIVMAIIFVVLPIFGLQGPNDFADPAKVLPFVASQPLIAFWLYPGDILFAVVLVLTVIGLHERLQKESQALNPLTTAAGLIASTLFLAGGTLGASVIQLAHSYHQDPAVASTAFVFLSLVSSNGVGLASGGIFAYGWWAALVSWMALRAGTFPKTLNYVGLVFGVAGIASILIPALGFLGLLVGIVWCVWLGAVLLRA